MNLIINKKSLTMTSREIAELVGSRHDKVKQSIERLATPRDGNERAVIDLPPLGEYLDSLGRPAKQYVFSGERGKRDSIVVVAQLSPEFTARLVDRWQELEAQVALPQQPTTPPLPSTQARVMIEDAMAIATLFKVPEHVAQVEAVKSARLTYNVDFSPLLLVAPAQNDIRPEDEMLEPTELGKRVGLSAIKMNQKLCEMGLQCKSAEGEWVPTRDAAGLYSRHQWVRGTKSGYNYKWKLKAVKEMLELLEVLS